MSIRLYGLDQPRDLPRAELDEIATLTCDALRTDGAGVNLLVDDLQLTVGTTGDDPGAIPRDISICSSVLTAHPETDLIEIPDLRDDPALASNPFVDGTCAAMRSYAAAPLTGKHGLALGTLCVWSSEPRRLDLHQRAMLRQFGRAVVNVLDEHRRDLVPDRSGALRRAH